MIVIIVVMTATASVIRIQSTIYATARRVCCVTTVTLIIHIIISGIVGIVAIRICSCCQTAVD